MMQSTLRFPRFGRAALLLLLLALPAFGLVFLPGDAPVAQKEKDPEKAPAALELRQGDHICLVGNTLADRMQHDGWLETMLQSRFPKHDLSVRNLGFSGDELTLRLRSAAFGSPDDWLKKCKADVVFAFFGYNESFAGEADLAKFKKDLEDFIKHTTGQKYNGKAAPRLVLFSPIAHENLNSPNLPDGAENNKRLALYAKAMADVAEANKVLFVDLYKPTKAIYAKAKTPLTFNGVHMTEDGNRQLAEVIDNALFPGSPEPKRDAKALAALRKAVLDKDFHWFNRYRTVDGYSIYGGRADLKFTNGQTNREVAQREMEVLDVMTDNRDKVIWSVAQGKDIKPEDGNTPDFIPVITNKPGAGPGGKHLFLTGEQSIKSMTIGKGLQVNLFASEETFPDLLVNPVQMSWDSKGRLWVATWPTYPHWKPKEDMNDKILILEDTDGDGKADKCTVFADHLHCPTGFELYNGGVIVAQAPDLIFLKDTDGDGKADVRQRILHGLDSADTHHTSNSFVLDPFGGLYFQEGTFHHTQVETPYGPPVRCANAGVYRYEPLTQKFDAYISSPFANPHGHVFDAWGQDIVVDGTGANPYHAALFSGHIDYPNKHPQPPQVYKQRTRPCPGMEYIYSRHFPEDFWGNLLVPNVIGFQGILRYRIDDKDSSFAGTELEPILSSSDPNFRPSDLKVGPDGAIYFLDWHNPIIGHMQHNLRDPSRDRDHGRIYRVTAKDRDLLKPVKIDGEPIAKLLDALKEPEDRTRYRARIELHGRKTEDVLKALKEWVAKLDPKGKDYDHLLTEAIWLQQAHNSPDVDLLKKGLAAKDFRARAAATRVLCYARDKVPEALELLKKQAADEHPRVRLEAVRAASFFAQPEALEVALITTEHPSDPYLEFCRTETLKTLEPIWKKAVAEGKTINFTSDVGARYFLRTVTTDDLLKMKRSRAVYLEMLFRKGIRDEARREALTGLASLDKKKEMRVLIDTLRAQDDPKSGSTDESVAFDIARLIIKRDAAELKEVRNEIEELATAGKQPVTRQLAYAALIAADNNDVDKAWALATKSIPALRDLLGAMPLFDVNAKAALYPKVTPLLDGLPKHLATGSTAKAISGRYVRVELPKGTLTLAEVEVYADGKNVARKGKATQKSTASGGEASRGIDGNTSGSYGAGGQTHTQENINNPWWEVDLGAEFPIESIVIYNRTDDGLGKRLDGFTLRVSDTRKAVVWEKTKQPAPDVKVKYELGGDAPEVLVRRAAMLALTSVRGQEAATFAQLARFVKADADRGAAVQAMLRIPAAHWPKEDAKPIVDVLLAYVEKLPPSDRTTPQAVASLELAEGLAALLPPDQARAVRKKIGDIGVRVLRIGTVHESMLFDKERMVVQAGKPVEFLFENTDIMPHNFVIIKPGTLEAIGNAGELAATQPGALERHYVPQSKDVLLGSKLLQPRESQQLQFTAPTKAGVYPYVCTYPGHWRRMHGALYVVDDLEAYQADPEGYLAKNPLTISDELLKFNRPRKEWTLAELTPLVEKMKDGRNFNTGRQLFTVANCVACHKFGGVGTEMGPDLTKYDAKWTTQDILKEVVEPSARINEKYYTYVFTLKSGKSVTGLIIEETPELYKVVENPLAKSAPVEIKKGDVDEKAKSPTSQMPKGLLDKLTPEEILDLLAYVTAKADPKHKLFEGGHDHH